ARAQDVVGVEPGRGPPGRRHPACERRTGARVDVTYVGRRRQACATGYRPAVAALLRRRRLVAAARAQLFADGGRGAVAGRALVPPGVEACWVPTDGPDAARLDRFDALWVVPGTPYRNDRPVFAGIERARTKGVPVLGTCGGFQHMVVEFARNAAGIREAAHAETDPGAVVHAVSPLACSLEGEVRQVTTVPGTRVAQLCGPRPSTAVHWCNYGVEPAALARL